MKRLHVKTLLTVAAIAVLATPAPAFGSGSQVIRDCAQDGDLDRKYSSRDLRDAEGELPTDVDEYTDCRDVINQAQVRGDRKNDGEGGGGGAGSSGTGGSSSGSLPTTPEDAKALDEASRSAESGDAPELSVGDQRIEPTGGGLLSTAQAANELPLPLLLVLISVAALGAGGGYMALRRRFPDARRFALRLIRR